MTARTGENRAAYLVLADELRGSILGGEYAGGRQLPTETSLAAEHRLSRQTVRRAYLELVSEGLVDRIPGRGTFAAEHGPRYLRQFGSVEDLMSLAIDTTIEIVRPLSERQHRGSGAPGTRQRRRALTELCPLTPRHPVRLDYCEPAAGRGRAADGRTRGPDSRNFSSAHHHRSSRKPAERSHLGGAANHLSRFG